MVIEEEGAQAKLSLIVGFMEVLVVSDGTGGWDAGRVCKLRAIYCY